MCVYTMTNPNHGDMETAQLLLKWTAAQFSNKINNHII